MMSLTVALAVAAQVSTQQPNTRHEVTTYGYVKAADLYEDCTSGRSNPVELVRASRCNGYISGIADVAPIATVLFYRRTGTAGGLFCLPLEAKPIDLQNAVVAAMRTDPSLRNGGAAAAVVKALAGKYPCN